MLLTITICKTSTLKQLAYNSTMEVVVGFNNKGCMDANM